MVAEDRLYSSVKYTTHLNFLIEISLKGKQPMVVKVSSDKLIQLIDKLLRNRQDLRDEVYSKTEQFEIDNADKYLDIEDYKNALFNYVGVKMDYIDSKDYKESTISYLEENREDLINLIYKIFYKLRDIEMDDNHKIALDRRIKLLKKHLINIKFDFSEEIKGELFYLAINYLKEKSGFATALNNTFKLLEFYLLLDADISIRQIKDMMFNKEQEVEFDEVGNINYQMFLTTELYATAVMNGAKTVFSNHENELFDFLEQPDNTIDKILKNINYKNNDLAAKLRNSLHHGRWVLVFPNKTNSDPDKILIHLYDGEKNNINEFAEITVGDLYKLSGTFYNSLVERYMKKTNAFDTVAVVKF